MKDLIFYHGPVGSGRTTKLIQLAYNYISINKPGSVLIYGFSDKKSKKGKIKSLNGLEIETINFNNNFNFIVDLKQRIIDDDMFNDGIETILIDDAHLLTEQQVDDIAKFLISSYGIPTICFGLKTNNKGLLFDGSKRLFEIATEIKELDSLCWCNNPATMNAKVEKGKIIKQGEQENNISSKNYKALCLKHFIKSELDGIDDNKKNSRLIFYHGPMSSGKSLEAIRIFYQYSNIGKAEEVIVLNHKKDIRHGSGVLASKSGVKIKSQSYDAETDFVNLIKEEYNKRLKTGKKISCLIIDEAQFLYKKQVTQLAKLSIYFNLDIICFGLRTNFLGKLFEGSKRLIELSTSIKENTKICWCGEKANMNARIVNGKVINIGDEVMIGGDETYQTLCLEHYLKGEIN